MPEHLSKLLMELRTAIHESLLQDDRVVQAMAALEETGQPVNIALDLVLPPGQSSDLAEEREYLESGRYQFTASDTLFLSLLGIAT